MKEAKTPEWLISDLQKELKRQGMKRLPKRKFAGILPSIYEATERLVLSGKLKTDIKPNAPVAEFLKGLKPSEYKLVLSEAAKIVHGEIAYDTRNKKISEIFKHMHRLTGGLVVHEIGASTGSWMWGVLYKSGVNPKLLYQTNFSRIPKDMLDTLEYNPVYHTGVNILDTELERKAPRKAHIVVVKDVLKFVNKRKRRKAFKNATKLVEDGGILIVGSALTTERDVEILSKMPYVIDGESKLAIFLKKGKKMIRVNPDEFIRILKESKNWDEYLTKIRETRELRGRISLKNRILNWREKSRNKRIIRKVFGK